MYTDQMRRAFRSLRCPEGFSLELDVNNITPNVRELFADETEQSYSNNTIIGGQAGDGTPVVMNFQGYSVDSKPKYEFDTFQTFHNKIKPNQTTFR
jgi:hypothetical protein